MYWWGFSNNGVERVAGGEQVHVGEDESVSVSEWLSLSLVIYPPLPRALPPINHFHLLFLHSFQFQERMTAVIIHIYSLFYELHLFCKCYKS